MTNSFVWNVFFQPPPTGSGFFRSGLQQLPFCNIRNMLLRNSRRLGENQSSFTLSGNLSGNGSLSLPEAEPEKAPEVIQEEPLDFLEGVGGDVATIPVTNQSAYSYEPGCVFFHKKNHFKLWIVRYVTTIVYFLIDSWSQNKLHAMFLNTCDCLGYFKQIAFWHHMKR